ncbi:MAG: MFS transporter [Oscillospiraceae bacterium]|nr:MFS transporter [Oscillospiraceae bacterium]
MLITAFFTKRFNLISFVYILTVGFVFAVYQSLLNDINEFFKLDGAFSGILITMYFVGSLFAPAVAGEVSDRAGKKVTLIAACSVMVSGIVIVSLARGVAVAGIGILLMGAGGCTFEGLLSAKITDNNPLDAEKFMNFSQVFFCIGAFLGPMLSRSVKFLGGNWQAVMIACFCIITPILVSLFWLPSDKKKLLHAEASLATMRGPGDAPGLVVKPRPDDAPDLSVTPRLSDAPGLVVKPRPDDAPDLSVTTRLSDAPGLVVKPRPDDAPDKAYSLILLKDFRFIAFFLSILMYAGAEGGIGFFISSYYAEADVAVFGELALSLFWAGMIIGRLLSGVFYKHSERVIMLCLVFSTFFSVLIQLSWWPTVVSMTLFFMIGMSLSSIWPLLMAFSTLTFNQYSGTAGGLMVVGGSLGGMLLPALTGFVSNSIGVRRAFIISTFSVVSILVLNCLRRQKSRNRV